MILNKSLEFIYTKIPVDVYILSFFKFLLEKQVLSVISVLTLVMCGQFDDRIMASTHDMARYH